MSNSRRLAVHEKLVGIMDSLKPKDAPKDSYKVYYNPTADIKLVYPCIIYKRNTIHLRHADGSIYMRYEDYQITVIDKRPTSVIADKVLELPYVRYQNEFITDNLHHYLLNLKTGGFN